MEFSPAFALLADLDTGHQMIPKSENEVLAISKYLGVDLPEGSLDDRITILANELSAQNGFLSAELESDSILASPEYRQSMFVREVVANNRINRRNRLNR